MPTSLRFFCLFIYLITWQYSLAARPPGTIILLEKTLKLSKKYKEQWHYAFAKGDEIIIEIEVLEGKPLEYFAAGPYGQTASYEDRKVKTITKIIKVPETGIYAFDLQQLSGGKSLCKVKIQRLPESEASMSFNTHVKWLEKLDTTYVPYEKTVKIIPEQGPPTIKKILVKQDSVVTLVLDRVERVSSRTKIGGSNKTQIQFSLPDNVQEPLLEIEMARWSYSLYVEGEGSTWYQKANELAEKDNIGQYIVGTGLVSQPYVALGLLALKGISVFSNPPQGDNVLFELRSLNGDQLIAQGNSVSAVQLFNQYLSGKFELKLTNDNILDGINVKVLVVAVQVRRRYKEQVIPAPKGKPIKEKRTFQKPIIKKIMVPVMAD